MLFKCRKGCDKRFQNDKSRKDHERKAHGRERKCDDCNLKFGNSIAYLNHRSQHNRGSRAFLLKSDAEVPRELRSLADRVVTDDFSSKFTGVTDLFYGKYAVRPHIEYPISHAGFEFVNYCDVSGMSEVYDNEGGGFFIRDIQFDFARQAHPLNYEGSAFQFGHIASAINYRKDKRALLLSYVLTNCVPLTAKVNRCVGNFEEEGKNIANNNWDVIILTVILLPEKDVMKFLPNSNVPIPDRVGKVFIYRNLDGLHIRGRRSCSNYPENEDDDDVDTLFQPFMLIEKGGITCNIDKRIIRTINGNVNRDYEKGIDDSSILPPFKPFHDLFVGKEMATAIGSTRTRVRNRAEAKKKQTSSAVCPKNSSSTSTTSSLGPSPADGRINAFKKLMKRK